jgi:hypothetical protein
MRHPDAGACRVNEIPVAERIAKADGHRVQTGWPFTRLHVADHLDDHLRRSLRDHRCLSTSLARVDSEAQLSAAVRGGRIKNARRSSSFVCEEGDNRAKPDDADQENAGQSCSLAGPNHAQQHLSRPALNEAQSRNGTYPACDGPPRWPAARHIPTATTSKTSTLAAAFSQ